MPPYMLLIDLESFTIGSNSGKSLTSTTVGRPYTLRRVYGPNPSSLDPEPFSLYKDASGPWLTLHYMMLGSELGSGLRA